MSEETIVAVFDSEADADAAVRDLELANAPEGAISRHRPSQTGTTGASREKGFWPGVLGGEPDHDTAVYDRSLEAGSHVVTVRVPEAHVAGVLTVLERHNPVDLDERAASYGLRPAEPAMAAGEPRSAAVTPADTRTAATAADSRAAVTPADGAIGNEERVQLAEEQLSVGKRLVNRGTTRIRRFVVETPVEENVTLHSERVSIQRRPVTDGARVSDVDFTDKTIEVSESDEEVVVGKSARVREEVVVRKEASERVETVRDTVRREDVEITKDGSPDTTTGRATGAAPRPGAR